MLALVGALEVSLFGGTAVQAAETDIRFGYQSEDNTPVDPVDPSDDLTLLYVPRAFDFGTKNNVTDTNFAAVNDTGKFFLALKDDRDILDEGEGNQWELKGAFSQLINESSGASINASVSFNAEDVRDYRGSSDPSTEGALGETAAGVTGSTVSLPADGTEVSILKADNAGKGQWAAKVADVQLNVLTAAEAGTQYTGTITWTLSDAI